MASVPDVFICGNDRIAIQLIYALQFLGYQIPKDVSVVGFDDIPASERITPSLTTIQTPKIPWYCCSPPDVRADTISKLSSFIYEI